MLPSDLLIERSWWVGQVRVEQAECVVSAIYRTMPVEFHNKLCQEVQAIVGLDNWSTEIHRWNDKVCPDKATAVAVLRQAEINCGLRPVEEDKWTSLNWSNLTSNAAPISEPSSMALV